MRFVRILCASEVQPPVVNITATPLPTTVLYSDTTFVGNMITVMIAA